MFKTLLVSDLLIHPYLLYRGVMSSWPKYFSDFPVLHPRILGTFYQFWFVLLFHICLQMALQNVTYQQHSWCVVRKSSSDTRKLVKPPDKSCRIRCQAPSVPYASYSSLILHVSAERAYWLAQTTAPPLSRTVFHNSFLRRSVGVECMMCAVLCCHRGRPKTQ